MSTCKTIICRRDIRIQRYHKLSVWQQATTNQNGDREENDRGILPDTGIRIRSIPTARVMFDVKFIFHVSTKTFLLAVKTVKLFLIQQLWVYFSNLNAY